MKKYDLVKLTNLKEEYKCNNLYLNVKGVILEIDAKKTKVLFLNEYNQGDYAYLAIDNNDLEIISQDNSMNFANFIRDNCESFKLKEKGFKKKEFNIYEEVELLVEKDKYSQAGIHKGDKGVIIENYAVKDCVLVDFGRLDNNHQYYGDCISVKLDDIKILTEKKD